VNAGAMNTALIVGVQINNTPGGNFAAKVCADYWVKGADGVTYGDWYLPSHYELNLLYKQKNVVGGFHNGGWYWSSNEGPVRYNTAFGQLFSFGLQDDPGKGATFRVRAVRAF